MRSRCVITHLTRPPVISATYTFLIGIHRLNQPVREWFIQCNCKSASSRHLIKQNPTHSNQCNYLQLHLTRTNLLILPSLLLRYGIPTCIKLTRGSKVQQDEHTAHKLLCAHWVNSGAPTCYVLHHSYVFVKYNNILLGRPPICPQGALSSLSFFTTSFNNRVLNLSWLTPTKQQSMLWRMEAKQNRIKQTNNGDLPQQVQSLLTGRRGAMDGHNGFYYTQSLCYKLDQIAKISAAVGHWTKFG